MLFQLQWFLSTGSSIHPEYFSGLIRCRLISWQVSVSQCNCQRQTPKIKIRFCLGAWFCRGDFKRLVRSPPEWTSSHKSSPATSQLFDFEACISLACTWHNAVPCCTYPGHYLLGKEQTMFLLSRQPPHLPRDVSLLKYCDPWEYIQLSTGWLSHS